MNSITIFWLALAVILGIVEAVTPSLICIWPAIGALITWLLSYLGAPLWLQIVSFIAISLLLVLITRPLAKKFVTKKIVATNADRVIGTEGIVVHSIDPIENSGQVKTMGQIWSAKSSDNSVIQVGTHVTVIALEGVKVIVKQK